MTTPAQAPPYQTFRRQVKVAPGTHLAFAAGHGYYDAPGGAHPAAAPAASGDPYAAIIASLPKPLTGAQITKDASGEISPLVAAATGQINKQTAAATHAISGFTGDAAAKLAAIDYGAPYQQGEQGQAAVDAALRDSLAGAGQQGADQLASRLGVINDPSVAAAAGSLAANGAANGATQVAQGSASLGELIANAAAAGDYGQKQPGIARLAGLQAIAQAGQQGQAQIAATAQQLEAQLPSIIQNLQSRNDARSSAVTAARENQLARQDAIASSTDSNITKASIANANNATREEIAKVQADGRASAASAAQARSDRSYRLQFAKTFGFDPVTNATLPGYKRTGTGQVVKVSATKAASTASSLTANEVSTLVQKWHDGKPTTVTVREPHADANGNTVYRDVKQTTGQVGYQQAYKYLRAHNQTDQQARTALNLVYGRGEQGRAYLTNEEQAALKKAGRQTTPGSYQGHAYIAPPQLAALEAAGMKPPGELVNGRYFIKPGG